MKSCAPEPTADIGHGAGAIQRSQHANPVDQQKWRRSVCDTQTYHRGQPCFGSHVFDGLQVALGGLMRHENQPGILVVTPDIHEGTEEYDLVSGPRGSGHHRGRPIPEAEQGIGRTHPDHPLEDAVEARIAEHADPLGGYAQAGKPVGIIG
jgi:hypothetical protein